MRKSFRALVTRASLKERFKTAQTYLHKLRFLIEDVSCVEQLSALLMLINSQPQHALPDVFIWLIANGKRIAYHRMNARDLIYSTTDEETGVHCGKMQTVFFKLPGKQAAGPAGWKIRAKLTIYAWLGMVKHKKFFFSGLPRGFELSQDLRNAERPRAMAPSNIHYLEKHVRIFLWQPWRPKILLMVCRHSNCALTSIKPDRWLGPTRVAWAIRTR